MCCGRKKLKKRVLKVDTCPCLILEASGTEWFSPAHRDGGGQASLAIYRCRKITIAAVNGHAVCHYNVPPRGSSSD